MYPCDTPNRSARSDWRYSPMAYSLRISAISSPLRTYCRGIGFRISRISRISRPRCHPASWKAENSVFLNFRGFSPLRHTQTVPCCEFRSPDCPLAYSGPTLGSVCLPLKGQRIEGEYPPFLVQFSEGPGTIQGPHLSPLRCPKEPAIPLTMFVVL